MTMNKAFLISCALLLQITQVAAEDLSCIRQGDQAEFSLHTDIQEVMILENQRDAKFMPITKILPDFVFSVRQPRKMKQADTEVIVLTTNIFDRNEKTLTIQNTIVANGPANHSWTQEYYLCR
jgi:hypothetical protein